MAEKVFIIYDGRAKALGTDVAQVMCCCRTLKEAREDAPNYGECDIYEYDLVNDQAVNERYVETRGGEVYE